MYYSSATISVAPLWVRCLVVFWMWLVELALLLCVPVMMCVSAMMVCVCLLRVWWSACVVWSKSVVVPGSSSIVSSVCCSASFFFPLLPQHVGQVQMHCYYCCYCCYHRVRGCCCRCCLQRHCSIQNSMNDGCMCMWLGALGRCASVREKCE